MSIQAVLSPIVQTLPLMRLLTWLRLSRGQVRTLQPEARDELARKWRGISRLTLWLQSELVLPEMAAEHAAFYSWGREGYTRRSSMPTITSTIRAVYLHTAPGAASRRPGESPSRGSRVGPAAAGHVAPRLPRPTSLKLFLGAWH